MNNEVSHLGLIEMKDALQELRDIMNNTDLSVRSQLLENWISTWVVEIQKTQYVVNKSVLNSDEIDFVWYRVAQLCAEEVIDNKISNNTTTNNSFTCSFMALRNPNGKLEENTKGIKKARPA